MRDSVQSNEPSESLFGRPAAEVALALPDREPVMCPLCRQAPTPFAVDFQGLHLARCSRCGLEFHSPRPRLDQLAKRVYGAQYHRPDEARPDERHERHYLRQLQQLERHLDPAHRRLLDVGCGAGAFLRFALERGWEAHGTDVVVTDWAKEIGARVWEGELPTISFDKTRYDVVRFNHVLEHTRNPLDELRRARELIRPGGLLLIGVPNLAGLSVRVKSWQSRLRLKRKCWRHYAALHHLWFFTPETLQLVAKSAGFEIVRWETPVMYPSRSMASLYGRLVEAGRWGGLLDLYARAC